MYNKNYYQLDWEEIVFTPNRDFNMQLKLECFCVSPVASDPHTLVELVNFSAVGKMQPFSVDISTNCLLLMVGINFSLTFCLHVLSCDMYFFVNSRR